MSGGAEFDEEVEPGWWKRLGEVGAGLQGDGPEVAFPDLAVAVEDPDPPEQPTPLPPPPADEEDNPDLPKLLEYDDDDDDEGGGGSGSSQTPPPPRCSRRENRGVPLLRYDDVFEAAIDMTYPSTVKEALGGDNSEQWAMGRDHGQGVGVIRCMWR